MPSAARVRTLSEDVTVKIDEPWMVYDYVFKLSICTPLDRKEGRREAQNFWTKVYALHSRLKDGVADRVKHINIILPKDNDTSTVPADGELAIGVVVEPSVALRGVDRGPSPEDEANSEAFRVLWGSKAELRRFKDGSILESVVWTSTDARALLEEIVGHLLKTHVDEKTASSFKLVGNDLEPIVPGFNPALSLFDSVNAAYRALEQDIRTAQGLPLSIRQISPASSALSYSSIALPFARKAYPAEPMDVVLQFEGSTRWPDDLQAIQVTKIALMLKLAEVLDQSPSKPRTRIGLENEHSDIFNRSYLQIKYPSSAAFNVRIHHDREHTLIERLLKSQDLHPKERENAAAALASYKRTFESRPAHCQAVQIIATRYPALSPTLRLVKRWFNAHLLGIHFPDELIEIITVRAFVHSQPWKPPGSAQMGLLRTLSFLARWEWQTEPLLVNFSGNLKSPELQNASTRFDAWRKIDPIMNRVALFVATNYDTDGTTWTEFSPAKVIASRMTSLAVAAQNAIKQQGFNLDITAIFQPSSKGYDFQIRLSKKFTRRNQLSKGDSKFKNMQRGTIMDNDLVGYDPIGQYLAELRLVFGECCELFYDVNGGDFIAGVWNPSKGQRRWKPGLPYSTIPLLPQEDNQAFEAIMNKDAMLEEMSRIGGDLVESCSTT